MHPVLSHFKKIPVFARAVAGGAALLAMLSLSLPAPGRGPGKRAPVAAPAPALIRAESRPVAGPLTLTSLAIGREPRLLAPGRHVVASFVTDDSESCHVIAAARLAAGSAPGDIRWTVAAPAGFVVPVEGRWTGPRLDVVLRRPGGNPAGLGGPLSLTIQAHAQVNGQEYTARETVVQDEVDQLRQEYVDLDRQAVPERGEFVDAAGFAARYGGRYPWLHFDDLNWSVNPNTRLRYSYAIIRPELVQGLDLVRRVYGSVTINSGYRNPVRQTEVHAPVRESLHQYGYAADLAVTPGESRGLPNEVDWRRLAEVACRARAKWVEPLASSAPNSPGCHVHLDYRPGPISSAPVLLRGQVVAAETGEPVAGALVLLGAMPARTDPHGFFAIRNVLSGGPYPVDVRAEGCEPLSQPVRLIAWGSASARLAVHRAVPRTIAIEVARASWIDRRARLLELTLRVTNAGSAEVGSVQLAVMPARGALVAQEPASLGALPAGAVRGVRVVVRLQMEQTSVPMPVSVDVAFQGASGEKQMTRTSVVAMPPGASEPASAARLAQKPPAAAQRTPPLVEGAQVAAPRLVPPAGPARPEKAPPSGQVLAVPEKPNSSGSAGEPAKPAPPVASAPAVAKGLDASKDESKGPKRAPPPPIRPAAASTEPKPPADAKPPASSAPAGEATPAAPPPVPLQPSPP